MNKSNNNDDKKAVSAKTLLRKLNAELSVTQSQLDELRALATDKPARQTKPDTIKSAPPVKTETALSAAPAVVKTAPQNKAETEPAIGRMTYHFKRSGKKKPSKTPSYQGTFIKPDKSDTKIVNRVGNSVAAEKYAGTAEKAIKSAPELGTSDIDELMKKYLPEEDYKYYQKTSGTVAKPAAKLAEELPDIEHFEAARVEKIEEPETGGLSEHDRAAIEAETAELFTTDEGRADTEKSAALIKSEIDIKKRIHDAEDYVRSITDQPPAVDRDGKTGEGEFDETDVNLMIAFGMDDELASTVGIDRVSEIEANLARESVQYEKVAEKGEEKIDSAFEFTSKEQVKGIFSEYKRKYRNLLTRLLVCTITLIAVFIYENIALFGGELPAPLNAGIYPVTHIMINLQLAAGVSSLFRLKPTPSSVLASVLAMTLVYDVVLCFAGIRLQGFVLFGFPAALCVFLSLVGEYYNLRREIFSFNIAASKRVKFAVDRQSPEDAALETEAFGEYMPERPSIFRVSRASFIDNFYRRSGSHSRHKSVIGVIIPLIIIISAIFFVVSFYITKDPVDSFTTAFLSFMMCMPASVFLLYSYPMFKASKSAFELDSAIIGEASVDEYTSASAISFDDKDVFPSTGVKVRSVKVYGNNRIDHVFYNAASIFSAAGGSLADVFDIATIDLGHSDNVEILDITADGLEATVDDKHIYLGRAPYLRRNSFVPVRDSDDEELEGGGDVCIMYMVCGEEVAAKLYVQYQIDPDFEFILKQLYNAGVCVGIKTSDPNIDDRMLGMHIKLDKYPVKVLKCRGVKDQNETKPRIDSGIVSKSSVKSLLQTLALCDKVQHITKTNIVIKLFSILIGVLLSGFLLALGLSADVMSVYVALYQLFWVIPMIIISKMFIN